MQNSRSYFQPILSDLNASIFIPLRLRPSFTNMFRSFAVYASSILIARGARPSHPIAARIHGLSEWVRVFPVYSRNSVAREQRGRPRQRHPMRNPSYDRGPPLGNCRRANCIFRRPRVLAANLHPPYNPGARRGALRILVRCRGI